MDPEAIRRCMSFGFSDKNSALLIGQCTDICSHSEVYIYFICSISQSSVSNSYHELIPILSDGNGFKTSTMRLGADVIVFSRHQRNRFYYFFFFSLYLLFMSLSHKVLCHIHYFPAGKLIYKLKFICQPIPELMQ